MSDSATNPQNNTKVDSSNSSEENYTQAKEAAREMKYVSTSLFTRRLRIGYAEASQIVERMEKEGFCEIGGLRRNRPTERRLL